MTESTPAPVLSVKNISVSLPKGGDRNLAVQNVSFDVMPGEIVCLVGESGSGKSVTASTVMGLGSLPVVSGDIRLEGEDLRKASKARLRDLRGSRMSMIFQEPMTALNPVHRVGEQVIELLKAHNWKGRGVSAEERVQQLFADVHLPDPARLMNAYPHQLSGGQRQRVMIAMALALEPALLIADEPTTALDATVQAQILTLLQDIRRETGMAMVLISHDLGVVAENVDRVCVMYAGRLVEEAPAGLVFDRPRHPYTRGLLAALPALEGPRRRLVAIPGTVPEPWNQPRGCAFAPRCSEAEDSCHRTMPPQVSVDRNERVLCFHARYHADPVHAPAAPAPVAHVAASGHAVAVIAQ